MTAPHHAHVLYLHGFGSGPRTAKGLALGHRLAGRVRSYAIPDLEAGDFSNMTMHSLCAQADAAIAALPEDGAPLLLIGSSLGGYLAAWLLAEGRWPRLAGALLIAPAFGFPQTWATRLGSAGVAAWQRDGSRLFFHHAAGRDLPLGAGFLASCTGLPALPAQACRSDGSPLPCVIVHGRQDEIVPWQVSSAYATERHEVELHLVSGDHRLTEPRHEDLLAWCAEDLLERCARR